MEDAGIMFNFVLSETAKAKEAEKKDVPTDSPKTGDDSLLAVYVLFIASFVATVCTITLKKRENEK